MNSKEIRAKFKDFFEKKGHKIVASDSMVIKGDPTLMFTNAGMNQFKDIFLGIRIPETLRVANSQKCLRVSGKHNDIEDVGHDTYHHTMFEMLGNWSFGDYFKDKAIEYAWQLLTEVYKIDKDRLYVTVFGGDEADNMQVDSEAEGIWKNYVDNSKILYGSKKDNFWEMGDTGPCGPCSEIHVDMREDAEREITPGCGLVNKDHPQVIEIWNLVFIQFNRKADGSLDPLPQKHVDTGMGFERLCAVLQNKKSNYDTDIFQTIIKKISEISGVNYGENDKSDIALRVVADHLRAVSFAIADGQLPSNVKAGYVIRRILRRAVRYAYSFLHMKQPFIYQLTPTLVDQMGDSYPELASQKHLIEKVIMEEESTFLRTLEKGIRLLDQIIENLKKENKNEINGKEAFVLYDTYGFPLDLTELIAKENNITVNEKEFDLEMQKQKERARNASDVNTDDWTVLGNEADEVFVGYDFVDTNIRIIKYREVKQKDRTIFHLVFDRTPFYAESGGQVGDTGYIKNNEEKINIQNTIKEHNQIIHITEKLPLELKVEFTASVDYEKRLSTARNHSATHLLHYALRKVLGDHVEQKGSLVDSKKLRFDFAHFNKMSDAEVREVERLVNSLILGNSYRHEQRDMDIDSAKSLGAISLFGEKYGEKVRVIQFGDSIELCGGTHVENTGQIGFFKIISESAIAAGIRRIEAITGTESERYIYENLDKLSSVSTILNNPKDLIQSITNLTSDNNDLKKRLEIYKLSELKDLKKSIIEKSDVISDVTIISSILSLSDPNDLKEICAQIRGEIKSFACVLGTIIDDKPYLAIAFSDNVVKDNDLNASQMIREAAKFIQGGGGGQAFIATAGGKNSTGMIEALEYVKKEILKKLS